MKKTIDMEDLRAARKKRKNAAEDLKRVLLFL